MKWSESGHLKYIVFDDVIKSANVDWTCRF